LLAFGAFALADDSSFSSASFRFCAGGRGGGGGRRRGGGGGGRLGALREDTARPEVGALGCGGGREGRGGCTIVVAIDMPAVETCEAVLESTVEELA